MDKQSRIYKKNEYNELLNIIKGHKLAIGKKRGYNMLAIANALNIDRKTLKSWLATPEAKDLIKNEIEYYINKMMLSGSNDWRQWKAQIDYATKFSDDEKEEPKQTTIIINDSGKGFSIRSHDI